MCKKTRKIINYISITLLMVVFSIQVKGDTIQSAYEAAQQFAQGSQATPSQALGQFQPNDIFTHFESRPSQSHYYGGETATNTALNTDVAVKASQSTAGQAVSHSINQRPDYRVETQSSGMQRSQVILQEAASIVQGISSRYADCTKTQTCKMIYQTEQCEESNTLGPVSCTKDLVVSAMPGPTLVYTVTLTLQGILQTSRTQSLTVDLAKGKVVSSPTTIRAMLSSLVPSSFVCEGSQVTVIEQMSLYRESPTHINITQLPDCSHPLQVTVELQIGRQLPAKAAARLTLRLVSKSPPVITEEWRDSCQLIRERITAEHCRLQNTETCSSTTTTRMINGVSITRPCWQTTMHYQCAPSSNTCVPLREKGCEQVGSACTSSTANNCLTHQQIFRCPVQQCSNDIGVVCNGETFCFAGDCTKLTRKADPDFQSSVSKLAAMNGAAKQFDTAVIFKGHSSSCSNDALGYSNCCRDTGWGIDLNLTRCDAQEKQLGHDKSAGVTIYVGEYCAHRILGKCTSKRKAYCTFPSKLARIIQQQGRPQLDMTFGNANKPRCNGLTPEQLQHIDMSKIDYREFYDDVMKAHPTSSTTTSQQQIQQRIQAWSEQGQSHDHY